MQTQEKPRGARPWNRHVRWGLLAALAFAVATPAWAAGTSVPAPALFGIRVEFLVFALVLIGVAVFHHHTLAVSLTGLAVLVAYKLGCTDYPMLAHLRGEWRLLLNLFGLLMGFSILARHFEASEIPAILPRYLPDDWKGGFVLLLIVFVLSGLIDNIAGAMIGGTMAAVLFKRRLHIGFLAAIVAASNAGGAGSVIGATTSTMMWIDGIPARIVLRAFVGSLAALALFGVIAARQQHAHQPIVADAAPDVRVDWTRVLIVGMIIVGAILANIFLSLPAAGVWGAILLGAALRPTHWKALKGALAGSCFLLALVTAASLMPVESLPPASWKSALTLGFVSAGFDNIPLTKLALDQGGFDWGLIAYAVAFGGSILWFGSSAGVAIANVFPEAKSVGSWLRHGGHIAFAYVVGFFVMLTLLGWHPTASVATAVAMNRAPLALPPPAVVEPL